MRIQTRREPKYASLARTYDCDYRTVKRYYEGDESAGKKREYPSMLDLYLVHHNIGTLWFGIGKPDIDSFEGLDYVIMIAIHKISDQSLYRKDMFKAKRKPLDKIWVGDTLGVAEIVRFSPSACNSQPWFVKNENGILTVSRYKQPGKRGIMPANAVSYYNRIDLGIFLCILELCLTKNGIDFERSLFVDDGSDKEYIRSAEYHISQFKKE